MTALNVSMAPTTRSLGPIAAKSTWSTVFGPASTGASVGRVGDDPGAGLVGDGRLVAIVGRVDAAGQLDVGADRLGRGDRPAGRPVARRRHAAVRRRRDRDAAPVRRRPVRRADPGPTATSGRSAPTAPAAPADRSGPAGRPAVHRGAARDPTRCRRPARAARPAVRRPRPAGRRPPARRPTRRPSPSTRSASSEISSPLWSTRPATSRIAPSRQVGPVCSYRRGKTTTSMRALQVLERHDRHRRLGLGDDRPDARSRCPPTTTRWPSSDSSRRSRRVGRHELADLLGHLAHRVLRQVQPEQLLLPAQPLADRHLGRRRQRALERRRVGRAEVEQRGLPGDPVALGRLGRGRPRRRGRAGSAPGGRTR